MIDNGDPIDGAEINDIADKLERVKDKLINLIWRNALGDNKKTIRSLDGKGMQILAATIPLQDKKSKDTEASIDVKFFNAFGGNKAPTVVAMPESPSPYGVSVKKVNREGFTLVIHQFVDNSKDDKFNLSAVHYIAIGPS